MLEIQTSFSFRSIALNLINGIITEPEHFDSVTVLFNAIEGFSEIANISTPMQLISIMHNLCMIIDRQIKQFDVYKVETTNDIYLVISSPCFH